MDTIYFDDINFRNLKIVTCPSNSESVIYTDGTTCYKIFKDFFSTKKLQRKSQKIDLLNEEKPLNHVVQPTGKIVNKKNQLLGCIMPYIPNSQTLFHLEHSNSLLISKTLYEISQTVRNIHLDPRNIIISDLHFDNILVDQKYQHYFIDFDSCSIEGIKNDNVPILLYDYLCLADKSKYRLLKKIIMELNVEYIATSQETDRLILILETLYYVFRKEIQNISEYSYDEKSEQFYFLKNMKPYFKYLKTLPEHPNAPYLDEFIPRTDEILMKKISR